MAFVRRKRIAGHEYLYLVEGTWANGQCHQRVLLYIGPVDDPAAQARANVLRARYGGRRSRRGP